MSSTSESARDRDLIDAARRQALRRTDREIKAKERLSEGLPAEIAGYRIKRLLGSGGMGVVYEAQQISTKRSVALKILQDSPYAEDSSKLRFQREIEIVADLRHPNIVVLHDSGVAEGKHYFAMDNVKGQPLDAFVRRHHLPVREIVELFVLICDAVSFVHRRGVMHRDLKPSNILVDKEGTPYVLDFGLAKIVSGNIADITQITQASRSGHLLGTVRYMSPEQTFGNPGAVDIRTDVYSLGVILYELLVGTLPYETGDDITKSVNNIREAVPVRPSRFNSRVDSEIDAIVFQSLEKDPDRRYQSAEELKRDLRAWLTGEPVIAKSASTLYILRKLGYRHRYAVILASLILVVASFGIMSLEMFRRQQMAVARQHESDAAVLQVQSDLAELGHTSTSAIHEQALGWFLSAWHADRLPLARQIYEKVPASSPISTAMGFLLDGSEGVEDLFNRIPPEQHGLANFVIGEKHLKFGRKDKATSFYETARSLEPKGSWLAMIAEARLRELQEKQTTQAPAESDEFDPEEFDPEEFADDRDSPE